MIRTLLFAASMMLNTGTPPGGGGQPGPSQASSPEVTGTDFDFTVTQNGNSDSATGTDFNF